MTFSFLSFNTCNEVIKWNENTIQEGDYGVDSEMYAEQL